MNKELEKIFDNNCNRMIKHHGNAMSKDKFVRVVSKLLPEQAITNLSPPEQTDEFQDELIESIEALLILIDPRLHLMDSKTIGKGKTHIWKTVVKKAQELVKQK